METDVFDKITWINFAGVLRLYTCVYFFLLRFFLLPSGLWGEITYTDVLRSDVQSIDYSVLSGVIASQRKALVMAWVSDRSILVSDSVLICICTFELRSESSLKKYGFSGYFYTFGFEFGKLLFCNMLSNTCWYIPHDVLYITWSLLYQGKEK